MAMPDPARRGNRLLVTGGSGYLGRVVCRVAADAGWTVIAPPSTELDVRSAHAVDVRTRQAEPTAVVHTAYRRDDEASIVDGTLHVTAAAAQVGARLVHLSSDAIFAGRSAPYDEHDEPDPIHAYGRAKAMAERTVRVTDPDAVVIRPSLIVSAGRVEHDCSVHEIAVRDSIDGTAPMTFFTDEFRCPVRVDDLARAVVDLAGRRDVTGVLHAGGPTAMSRSDLASAAAARFGWDGGSIRVGVQADLGVDRPARVVLRSSRAATLGLRLRGPESWPRPATRR